MVIKADLEVDVRVGGDVGREGVDGAPVVDDQEQQGKLLLGGSVKGFRHASVLRRSLAEEHDGHPDKKLRRFPPNNDDDDTGRMVN